MKTATVRDLRNRFADVAKLIEEGESVAITRRGETFATLSPMTSERSAAVDWKKRLASVRAIGRKATRAQTDAFWKELRD
jgi:antitoxin (DNA-binding transcriptional repressor) of toxin-antitoxin stability system